MHLLYVAEFVVEADPGEVAVDRLAEHATDWLTRAGAQ
jgi:hypothetical protein